MGQVVPRPAAGVIAADGEAADGEGTRDAREGPIDGLPVRNQWVLGINGSNESTGDAHIEIRHNDHVPARPDLHGSEAYCWFCLPTRPGGRRRYARWEAMAILREAIAIAPVHRAA